MKDDPDFQNLTKAQETEMREELLASRDLKRLGARPSNRSAAQDYRRQLEQLNNEVCKTVVVIVDINLLYLRSPRSLSVQVLLPFVSSREVTFKTPSNQIGSALRMPLILQKIASTAICGIFQDYLSNGLAPRPKVS